MHYWRQGPFQETLPRFKEEKQDQGIVLFPNPVQDVLMIECAGLSGTGWELNVVDPMGRTIHFQNMSVGSTTRIPIAHLPSGTYCALIRRAHEVHARRFIKLH